MITRFTVGVAAVAGACALGACGSSTGSAAPASATTSAAEQSTAASGSLAATESTPASKSTTTAQAAQTDSTPRCTTGDLSVSLGTPKESQQYPGQYEVPLTYKNNSSRDCGLYGVPGVDLVGPDDPNGDTYHLTRVDNGVKYNVVTPGGTASAGITVLKDTDGSEGSNGSKNWTPTTVKTIPPGETTALTAQWPSNLPVLRQDSATHPGTYVNGILADPA
ncbi:DUF4232 domain-containing protein [Amycolatopsis acidicola]|uniref:DUF4232 domain-containing protein n=2 Tax=Amycolatopsis acidicola TaxID=2596893 RepID=A0A5N0UWB1_9PSEU|nr:DUF4232 domain-containing protein [Amycolatopsis acidicola]